MKDREHEIQVECVKWFRMKFREARIMAIPNGGQRNVIVAAKMKAEGVLAGVPDLFVPVACGGYHGLWIEMKKSRVGVRGELVGKGVVSEAQEEMIAWLRGEGYKCDVVYSFDEFRRVCEGYLG